MDVRDERTGPARVLCGDADREELAALTARLSAHDSIAPEPASDLETVLERLDDREESVDCVVLSGSVVGASRLELLSAVRERDPDLPVVFYPRDPSLEEASEATAAGVDAYLPRSFDPDGEELLARVEAALEEYDRRVADRRERSMFRSLMESIPLSIYFKDRRGRYVAGSGHIDSSVEEDPIGKTDVDLWFDRLGQKAVEAMREDIRVAETGEPVVDREVKHERADEGTLWFRSTKVPWRNEDGEIVGVIGITRDVSEVKEREADLERQKRLLEQFASFASHDLRNPINVAKGYLELVAMDGDEAAIDEVGYALDRMEDLVDDLLSMAREEPGNPSTEWLSFEESVAAAWEAIDTDGATLDVDLPAGVNIEAAGGRFRQLLENLFENAVEHAGPDVTVTVGLADTGFYVEDDGPGIDADDPSVVFEYGYTDGGTGIGLAIAKEVAESHGWVPRVSEGADGGARFAFERCLLHVPARRDVEEGDPVPLTERTNVDDAQPVGEVTDDGGDRWTVSGGGQNFWGDLDEYYAVCAPVDGDVRIVARVADLEAIHQYSKAGLLCCESPEAGSPLGFVGATVAHGTETLWRRARGERIEDHHFPELDGRGRWYRLDRIGETVTCFTSSDGEEWTVVDQLTVEAADAVSVGLAVCSHNSNRLCDATFEDVRVTPLSARE